MESVTQKIELSKLSLSHLQGLFLMLGAGSLVGIIVLVVEILIHKHVSVPKIGLEIK